MTRKPLHAANDLQRALTAANRDPVATVEQLKALGWTLVRSDALPLSWLSPGHKHAEVCPGCGEKLSAVGLPKIAYVHDGCDCGTPDYVHLVEQLWHRACLTKPMATIKESR